MHSNKSQTPPGNCPFRANFLFKFIEYLMACLGLAIALGPQTLQSQDCISQPVTTGYRDFNFGSSIHYQPTAAKPESKLWWNDGFWWGSLWSTSANKYRIHRFDWDNQCWQNTGPDIDDRTKSLADALWDGSYLYIASHMAKTSSGPARLYRYSYSSGSKSYSLDSGFPVQVNNESSETLTLAKDSAGKLWVSWTADNNIMVNRSTSNDRTWGAPFVLPVQGAPVANDDISAIVAFGDNKIGIMWSNQIERKMYFASHLDGQADASWQPREAVLEDPNLALADDHINLKVMPDDGGNVYAVTKTSLTGSNDPLIYVLKRASNGQCTRYVFGTHADNHTRPSLLIDEENRRLYVFAMSVRSTPHLIYMKSTSLDSISFSSGLGTVFLQSATDQEINNPTSTKQNLNGTTNLLVLASDEDSNNYLHNYIDLPGGSGNNPPVAVDDPVQTGKDTPAEINVTGNDTDADGIIDVSSVAIASFPAHGAIFVNATSGVVTYTPNAGFTGVDSFSYTVNDDDGAVSNAALVTITVGLEPATLTFNPSADAHVYASSPSTNYGANAKLRLRSSDPQYNTYLKFNVAGLSGQIQDAKLRLYVTNAGPDGGAVYAVSNNYANSTTPWIEEGLRWSNAPVLNGAPLSQAGALTLDAWVELNVTSAITGNGVYSFGMSNNSTNSIYYSSKEGENPPQLVIRTSGSSGNNPPVANTDAAATSQNTAVSIDVLINDSDADGALDPATVTVVSLPSNGTITGINSATGVITYTPNAGYTGTDAFTYTVSDTAGAASNVATVDLAISGSGPVIFTFNPSEDAYVYSPYPTKSHGANTKLRLRNPDYKSYLKFDVTGLGGHVQSAKLRLYVTNASPDGGSVYAVSNNYASSSTPWVEQGLTWNNAPAIADTSLSQLGSVELNTWVEFNVTTAIAGEGVYSFGLTSASENSVFYSSKEDSQPPQLVIETSPGVLTASKQDNLMRKAANDNDAVSGFLLPLRFALSQNYPNPFNTHTIIKYALPDEVHVRLVIYDLTGNEVITLVDQIQPMGYQQANWDGKNRYGQEVASGVYLYLLQAGRQKITRNMTWLK